MDVSNYCPISKLSCISKLFKKLIKKKPTFFFLIAFINNQYNFQKFKSIDINVLKFYTAIVDRVSNNS